MRLSLLGGVLRGTLRVDEWICNTRMIGEDVGTQTPQSFTVLRRMSILWNLIDNRLKPVFSVLSHTSTEAVGRGCELTPWPWTVAALPLLLGSVAVVGGRAALYQSPLTVVGGRAVPYLPPTAAQPTQPTE